LAIAMQMLMPKWLKVPDNLLPKTIQQ